MERSHTILTRTEWMVVGFFALLKIGIQIYFNIVCGFHRDEYLYLAFYDHLDWGYASVPPFMGFISWMVNLLGSQSHFWVRFFPTLAGGASIIIIALLVKELGGQILAIVSACLAFIFSVVFLRVHSFLQPVAFDQFFWLLSFYFIVKMARNKDTRLWYPIFIIWGIGFMNKYLIAVLILSSLLALLLNSERKVIFSKHFVFGGLIALAIILPNILWQYHHDWPVLFHMKELNQTQLVNVLPIDFLSDQVIMNLNSIVLLLLALIFPLFFKSFSRYRFIAVTYVFLILILLITHGKNYYTIGIYPILWALGGYVLENIFIRKWRFVSYVIIGMIVLLPLPYIPLTTMPFLGNEKIAKYSRDLSFDVALRWEDGKTHAIPQDFADMTGWEELYSVVSGAYNTLGSGEKANMVIFTGNYGQAGSIKYYGKRDGIPEPISFIDSFLLWAPDSIRHLEVMIYVDQDTSTVRRLFHQVMLYGSVTDPYFREDGLPVYICKYPYPEFYPEYKSIVARRKNKFH